MKTVVSIVSFAPPCLQSIHLKFFKPLALHLCGLNCNVDLTIHFHICVPVTNKKSNAFFLLSLHEIMCFQTMNLFHDFAIKDAFSY